VLPAVSNTLKPEVSPSGRTDTRSVIATAPVFLSFGISVCCPVLLSTFSSGSKIVTDWVAFVAVVTTLTDTVAM
jgi:hypothetical protein